MAKTAVEQCFRLSLSAILQEGHIFDSLSLQQIVISNHNGMPVWTLAVIIRLLEGMLGCFMQMRIAETGQVLRLRSTPLHFGGVRWWFDCPDCSRRCADLYATRVSTWFSCRLCRNLTYQSAKEAHCKALWIDLEMTRRVRLHWRRKRDRRPDYRSREDRFLELTIPPDERDESDSMYWIRRRSVLRMFKDGSL